MNRLPAALAERVVVPRPDCMIWNGGVDRDGYGNASLNGKPMAAHRLAWILANGPIPSGFEIDHLCRVRPCVNAAHMELLTHAENVRRAAPHRPRSLPGGGSSLANRLTSQLRVLDGHWIWTGRYRGDTAVLFFQNREFRVANLTWAEVSDKPLAAATSLRRTCDQARCVHPHHYAIARARREAA